MLFAGVARKSAGGGKADISQCLIFGEFRTLRNFFSGGKSGR